MDSLQATYDEVKRHLLTQGRQAATHRGLCRYRTSIGLKCAVGCLIPDELYRPGMEAVGLVYDLVRWYPDAFGDRFGEDGPGHAVRKLLYELQIVHDSTPGEWPEGSEERRLLTARLADVALAFGLQP